MGVWLKAGSGNPLLPCATGSVLHQSGMSQHREASTEWFSMVYIVPACAPLAPLKAQGCLGQGQVEQDRQQVGGGETVYATGLRHVTTWTWNCEDQVLLNLLETI